MPAIAPCDWFQRSPGLTGVQFHFELTGVRKYRRRFERAGADCERTRQSMSHRQVSRIGHAKSNGAIRSSRGVSDELFF